MPLERVYTSTETFRNADAEFIYQRWVAEEAHRAPNLESVKNWPPGSAWRPRAEIVPGMHAGILTTPIGIFKYTGLRANLSGITHSMWCTETRSANVATDVVLG